MKFLIDICYILGKDMVIVDIMNGKINKKENFYFSL